MKTLGVIGGLGPMATVYFLELVTKLEHAQSDQEHIPIVMESIPRTPDRTAYILNPNNPNPLPFFISAGKHLKEIGAEYVAIPCVTAHFFHDQLSDEIGLPVISIPVELGRRFHSEGVSKVGILATSGTIYSNFLQNELHSQKIEVITPNDNNQKIIMSIIYDEIKAGKEPNVELFLGVGEQLQKEGAQKLVLGCTELSLIQKDYPQQLSNDYVDVLEVLAEAAIRYSKEN